LASRVSIEVTPTVALTLVAPTLAGSQSTVPLRVPNSPRTVLTIMWVTLKPTRLCVASTS